MVNVIMGGIVMAQEENKKLNKDDLVEFLRKEYTECFNQIRHYDGVANKYFTCVAAGYPIIIGGISALYDVLSDDYNRVVVSAMLLLTFFVGLAILGLLLTNRSNYAVVSRQINAIRHYFLKNTDDLNFLKYNRAHLDPDKPDAYSPRSTSIRFFDIIAILNSLIGAGCVFFILAYFEAPEYVIWIVAAVLVVILLIGQKMWGIRYLKERDEELKNNLDKIMSEI